MTKNWYVLSVVNGKEKIVKETIEKVFNSEHLSMYLYNILLPVEKVKYVKNGKVHVKEKSFLPGYIFIECEMNGETERTLKGVSYVKKIIGNKNVYSIVSKTEINDIMKKIDMSVVIDDITNKFIIGESVKITDGPFTNFDATIQEILSDRNRIKISVKIFGRETIMEVDTEQIIKKY